MWWLRLGIGIERIKPGNPQQNGRQERMHPTLKKEVTKPAATRLLQQQVCVDRFIGEYNRKRPHQALGMKYPADVYSPSPCPYRGIGELKCPFYGRTITVTHCGRIWLVSFMHYNLGFFDRQTGRITNADIPFGA